VYRRFLTVAVLGLPHLRRDFNQQAMSMSGAYAGQGWWG